MGNYDVEYPLRLELLLMYYTTWLKFTTWLFFKHRIQISYGSYNTSAKRYAWLLDNVGSNWSAWRWRWIDGGLLGNSDKVEFCFRNKRDLMMFLLRWS